MDGMNAEIRHILIALAQQGKTITYSELVTQLQTAYIHHRAPRFHRILQDMCEQEVRGGRPILGVLVVTKATGRPGAGFFKWCAAHGYDVTPPEAFWQAEFDRVCAYWKDK